MYIGICKYKHRLVVNSTYLYIVTIIDSNTTNHTLILIYTFLLILITKDYLFVHSP